MTISKKDAAELVERIKSCNVSAHAIAMRHGSYTSHYPAFVGGIEMVLQHFLRSQGHDDAAEAIAAAFNATPSKTVLDEHNAKIAGWSRPNTAAPDITGTQVAGMDSQMGGL